MKCNYCGSEWNATGKYSQVNTCPFCQRRLIVPVTDEASLDYVIRTIFDKFGYELILDNHKFISVFSDLAPKMKSERKMLTVALDQGIGSLFVNTTVSNREAVIRQSIRELQVIMSENAIHTVISAFISALEWDIKLTELLPTSLSIENNSVCTDKDTEGFDKADIESTLSSLSPLSPVVTSNHISIKNSSYGISSETTEHKDEKIDIDEISFFSNDGDMNHPTVESDDFLQGHAQYIGIKVFLKKQIENDMDAELHWTIYKENGSMYSKEIITVLHFHKGDIYAFNSWGWATPGEWAVGKYKVVAYFKNKSSPFTAYFTVYAGYYCEVKKLKSVRLFAGGEKAPVQNSREYTNTFHSSSLRRVYFEFLIGSRIRKDIYTYMHVVIRNSNNSLMYNALVPIGLGKGCDSCWTGWGWNEPNNWTKGRYTFEVSIHGSNIITGSFNVL